MYTDFIIKNSKMQMFVSSVLSQLDEAVSFNKDKVAKEVFSFIKNFIEEKNKLASSISKNLMVPYLKSDYLKIEDAAKIVANLEGAKITKNNIEKAFNNYLKDKNLKSLKAALVSIGNSPSFSESWRSIQGNLQAPAKIAFIHFLKKYFNIIVPVNYTGIDRDPTIANKIKEAKIYPVYPIHLLNRFIELQVLSEFVKKNQIDEATQKEILNGIFTSSNIKNEMLQFVKTNKDGDFDAEVRKPIQYLDIETVPAPLKHSPENIGPEHAKQRREEITKAQF